MLSDCIGAHADVPLECTNCRSRGIECEMENRPCVRLCMACKKSKCKCNMAEVRYAAEQGIGEVAGASGLGVTALKERMTRLEKKTTKMHKALQKDIDKVFEQANTAHAAANTVFDSHRKLKVSVESRFERVNQRLDDHDNWLGEMQYTQCAHVDRVE